MAATPRSDRAWAATRKGLFELQRTGDAGWRVGRASFLGDPVTMLLPPGGDGGTLLAALNLGHFGVKLHASDDGGASWHETAVPTYPEQPAAPAGADVAGAAGAAATAAPDVPWKLSLLWSLERDAAGTLWAGTIPGGLFRSGDGGVSWRLVESLWRRPERAEWMGGGYDAPGIHSICPHPGRPGELLIGISCGGAWTTRDDGASWALTASGMRADFMPPELAANPNIQDAHRIQRCADRPDVLWCQHHGGIWRSVDGAASWQAVTTAPLSSFGFAVAAHPRDPGSAWFVPAVADQQRVPVAANLPPIYAVRFG